MKRSFLLIAFYAVFIFINAQNNELKEIVKSQLKAGDKKSISKAEKDYAEAAAGMEQARQIRKKNKAAKIKVLASRKYGKANKVVYKVYKNDVTRFFNNIDAVQKKKAQKKVKKAGLLMKEAKKKRELALRLNAPENSYSHLSKADKLEDEAISNLLEVYDMFIDKSKVIAENKTEEVENNVAEKETVEEKEQGEPILASIEDENNEVVENTANVDGNKTEIENVVKSEVVPIEIKGTKGVFFLLQVAASKTPISIEKLKLQFKSEISGDLFGEWYRYFINEKFSSLEEAENYKNELGAKGLFVIAFKNGKKVSIKEALEKEILVVASKIEKNEEKDKSEILQVVEKTTFRLEIGVSTSRLSVDEVSKFKNAGKSVIPIDRGGWYSYTIGDFQNEAQALNFKKIKRLEEASIVKVRGGRIVD